MNTFSGLLYSHLDEFSLKIYYMALWNIFSNILLSWRFESKRFPTPVLDKGAAKRDTTETEIELLVSNEENMYGIVSSWVKVLGGDAPDVSQTAHKANSELQRSPILGTGGWL